MQDFGLRLNVLEQLNYIDSERTVQLKGRCVVSTRVHRDILYISVLGAPS